MFYMSFICPWPKEVYYSYNSCFLVFSAWFISIILTLSPQLTMGGNLYRSFPFPITSSELTTLLKQPYYLLPGSWWRQILIQNSGRKVLNDCKNYCPVNEVMLFYESRLKPKSRLVVKENTISFLSVLSF